MRYVGREGGFSHRNNTHRSPPHTQPRPSSKQSATHTDTHTYTQAHTRTRKHTPTRTNTKEHTDTQTHRPTDTQTHTPAVPVAGAAVGTGCVHPGHQPCVVVDDQTGELGRGGVQGRQEVPQGATGDSGAGPRQTRERCAELGVEGGVVPGQGNGHKEQGQARLPCTCLWPCC